MKGRDMGMWIAIGAGVGTALGVALGNIGVGIALGAGIGVAIGASQGAFGKGSEDEILEDENSRALRENEQMGHDEKEDNTEEK
jgi:hypothetical protein